MLFPLPDKLSGGASCTDGKASARKSRHSLALVWPSDVAAGRVRGRNAHAQMCKTASSLVFAGVCGSS